MKLVSNFCERLTEYMEAHNIKAADIARAADLSKSTLSRYLQETRTPNSNSIYAIADALHISDRWLYGYDVPINYNPAEKLQAAHVSTLDMLTDKEAAEELVKLLACYEKTAQYEYNEEKLKYILMYCNFVGME